MSDTASVQVYIRVDLDQNLRPGITNKTLNKSNKTLFIRNKI